MSTKKRGTRKRVTLGRADNASGFPQIDCDSQYSASCGELQDEIMGKFAPKRLRAETVAELYHSVSGWYAPEREKAEGKSFYVRQRERAGEVVFHNPIEELFGLVGEEKAMRIVWSAMCDYVGADLLECVAGICYSWYSRHGFRVDECGTFLEFHVTEEKAALRHANFCRDRFCPMCNWRRSLKIFGQVSRIMEKLDGETADGENLRYLFLTLTVRNVWEDELSGAVQALYNGWRVLYHHYMRGSRKDAEKRLKNVVVGTFRALEVTVSDGEDSPAWAGSFHPHLHVILAVKESYFQRGHYLTSGEWAEVWKKACGLDYHPSVNIQAVRPKDLIGPLDAPPEAGGKKAVAYGKAVAELSKYPLKDADFVNADSTYDEDRGQYLSWLVYALRGRRLVGLTGRFLQIARELQLDDMEQGDLVHVDDEDIREDLNYLIVRYHWCSGVYVPVVFRPAPKETADDTDDTDERPDDTYRLTPEDVTPEAAKERKRQVKGQIRIPNWAK